MKIAVEIDKIHDLIMLDMIIDMWKDKFNNEEANYEDADEEQDDDADEESEDGRQCITPETEEEKAHRKALDKFAECLRNSGIADVSFTYMGNAKRRNDRG